MYTVTIKTVNRPVLRYHADTVRELERMRAKWEKAERDSYSEFCAYDPSGNVVLFDFC